MYKYVSNFLTAISCLLFMSNLIAQQNYHLIPEPAEVKMKTGKFLLSKKTTILAYQKDMEQSAALLNSALQEQFGITLPVKRTIEKGKNYISFSSVHGESSYPDEGYRLTIATNTIEIAAKTARGNFYGIQTLMQILDETTLKFASADFQISIPNLSINDHPRFAYRGMHLDVARHFFTVKEVKRYIDFLATYKFNRFHWHLTDDQGWRIEIKKYPLLTQVGGWRNGTIIGRYPGTGNDSLHYGGFYTQEEIKEVVRYAASKYIEVIPEIEMPGHASAAIAAYPQLSCFPGEDTKILASTPWAGSRQGKQVQQTWGVFEDVFCPSDYTFNFLQDVVDEVMPLFPSKYIHIGGDECPKESWKRSEFCQQLIQEKNLKDEHGLQSYFIQRMEKYINSKGKKIIGWDEILEGGLAPNATVMSWRGEAGGIAAAKQGHDVIMTPQGYVYFDHTQSKTEDSVTIGGYTPLENVYAYEPIPAALSPQEQHYVLGAQANLWTEYIGNEKKIEYMIFPRIAALAEVLWTPAAKRNWKKFEKGLPVLFKKLDDRHINYSTAFYQPVIGLSPTENNDGIRITVNSKQEKSKYYFGNKTLGSFLLYPDSVSSVIDRSGVYGIRMLGKMDASATPEQWGPAKLSGFEYLFKTDLEFSFNKATAKKIILAEPPASRYAGNGAFTLVDGIQNSKGLVRAGELLGFNGKDIEAVIDLGQSTSISEIRLHAFEQTGSWIYRPAMVLFYTSMDNKNFTLQDTVVNTEEKRNLIYSARKNMQARYIKVIAKNNGIIAAGQPGAGSNAWVFADEIEVF